MSRRLFGEISALPHTSLCMQFSGEENSVQNSKLPFGLWLCVTMVWGCAEIFPFLDFSREIVDMVREFRFACSVFSVSLLLFESYPQYLALILCSKTNS